MSKVSKWYDSEVTTMITNAYEIADQQERELMRKANIEYIMVLDRCDEEAAQVQDALGRKEAQKYLIASTTFSAPVMTPEGNIKVDINTRIDLLPGKE